MSYNTEFSNLGKCHGHIVNVTAISIVDSVSSQHSSRQKWIKFQCTLFVVDVSILETNPVEVHIVLPYRNILPIFHRGDVVELGKFEVRDMQLWSTGSSYWKVTRHEPIIPYTQCSRSNAGAALPCGDLKHYRVRKWMSQGSFGTKSTGHCWDIKRNCKQDHDDR